MHEGRENGPEFCTLIVDQGIEEEREGGMFADLLNFLAELDKHLVFDKKWSILVDVVSEGRDAKISGEVEALV